MIDLQRIPNTLGLQTSCRNTVTAFFVAVAPNSNQDAEWTKPAAW